jgi:probable rRNA maturation factor
MIVNAEKAKREAEARGHDERSELALYIVHGMLHNLGFDDLEPQQGRLMHSMENRILAQTGYGAVYGQ